MITRIKSRVLDQRGNGTGPGAGSEGNRGTHGELEEVVGAEARKVEAADVAVVVLAADLPHVAVAVGAHELIELLPDGVHGAARGAGLPSPSLGLPPAKGAARDETVAAARDGIVRGIRNCKRRQTKMDWVGIERTGCR